MNLIIGASGRMGSILTRKLLDEGKPVRAQSRDPEAKLGELIQLGAEPVKGDLREDGWIDNAMQGVERLVMASQGLFPPDRRNHAGTVDEPGNRKLIDAAKRAGVEHIIFISATFAEPDFPSRFIRAKYMTEELLKKSGVPYTIIRPATTFTEAHGCVMLGQPLRESGTVQFFGRGETPLRWISADDVADYIVTAFDNPDDLNAIRTIGGPDILSRVQILEVFERYEGRKAKRKHVPLAMMRVMRVLTKPVHPGLSDLISFAIAEETMPDHPGFAPRELDWIGPTTVDDVVRRWAGVREPEAIAAN